MRFSSWLAIAVALCGAAAGQAVYAQVPTNNVTGSLVTLVNSGQYKFNRLERLSAIGNQEAYNQLFTACVNAVGPGGSCPAAQFRIFKVAEELVQSADELLAVGPTQFSLRVDAEGLGFALRWTAAEELSAPGSVSTEFVNTQIASVMSRITALRFGATGTSVADAGTMPRGGSAGADGDDLPTGRWGGYLDGGYGAGLAAGVD